MYLANQQVLQRFWSGLGCTVGHKSDTGMVVAVHKGTASTLEWLRLSSRDLEREEDCQGSTIGLFNNTGMETAVNRATGVVVVAE